MYSAEYPNFASYEIDKSKQRIMEVLKEKEKIAKSQLAKLVKASTTTFFNAAVLQLMREKKLDIKGRYIIRKEVETIQKTEPISKQAKETKDIPDNEKIEYARQEVAKGTKQADIAKALDKSLGWVNKHTKDVLESRKESLVKANSILKKKGVKIRERAEILMLSERTIKSMPDVPVDETDTIENVMNIESILANSKNTKKEISNNVDNYTTELEKENARLREENESLRKENEFLSTSFQKAKERNLFLNQEIQYLEQNMRLNAI